MIPVRPFQYGFIEQNPPYVVERSFLHPLCVAECYEISEHLPERLILFIVWLLCDISITSVSAKHVILELRQLF